MSHKEKSSYLDEELNPCVKERNLSMKCLHTKGYNTDECQLEFLNFNTCKKFWGKVYADRKKKGIPPFMPGVEERKQIKADYMAGKYKL